MSITKKLWVLMGLQDKEFQARMDAVVKRLRTAQAQSVRDARRLSITTQELFYGMTVPIGLFAGSVIDATKRIESLHKGLRTIAEAKGITNIDKLIQSTTELAKLPGLGLEETFGGVRSLIAVGYSARGATEAVKGLGIGIARAGGNAETFGRVMVQLTQGLAKGKLELQDFKTVFEQMPESRGILERAFGPGMSDLEKLREEGIKVNQVVDALVKGFTELGAEGFMDSLSNKIENLSDNWLKFRHAIGEKLFKDQINKVLDTLSRGLETATKAIDDMSPGMKQLIQDMATWVGIIAVVIPAGTFLAKMFLLLKANVLGFLKFFARNPYVAVILGFLGAMDWAGRQLDDTWEGLGKETGKLIGKLKDLWKEAVKWGDRNSLFPGLRDKEKNTFDKLGFLPGLGIKAPFKGGKRDYSGYGLELGIAKGIENEIDDIDKKKRELEERLKRLDEIHLDWIKNREETIVDRMKKASEKIYEQLTTVTDAFMQRGDMKAGLYREEPRKSQGTYEDGLLLFADDTQLSKIDTLKEKLKEIKQEMQEMFTGPIAQGIIGVSDAFGTFVETVLNNGKDAFGAMAKAMGQAVKQMIVDLVKLIAKLAIAALLVAIIFPNAGGLKALASGSGGFAKGGQFFGKGNFLKGILGSMGIGGFAEGGVVGGNSYYGDKIMARVNTGELVLNKRQQAAAYSQMTGGGGNIFIRGELRARGRDLVYVLEENQVQINSAR